MSCIELVNRENEYMKKILKYTKRAFFVILVITAILVYIGYSIGARVHYDDNPLAKNWDNEGPYIFFESDNKLSISYLKGNLNEGYYLEKDEYLIDSLNTATSYYPLDKTRFNFEIRTKFKTPRSTYDDSNKILAISDIESNYKTFRDFLINSNVINETLDWTFSDGHLVLVGDFVDRGYFTTQVLWFIYKLEQEAEKHGGQVHYIIGNHELKMMHGNYGATDQKYHDVSSILNRDQSELYSSNSLLGKWLASKNTIELINGNLFTHGGLHPDLAETELGLEEINRIIRDSYYTPIKPESTELKNKLFTSKETGLAWYRGYFKDNLTQEQVELGLQKFKAKSIVVGHTLQSKVNRLYNGKVIGIDVQHPNDDHKLWPEGKSEALLIENDKYYRVFANGEKEEI